MVADFMNDAEYIALCGSRTVLDVVSTLTSIFDRHDPGSYEAKTVGRIVDLPTIRNEISSLQLVLEDSRKLSNYFRKTALYLQERELAVQKHMEWLRKREKEQERLRAAFKTFILPKEITDRVLDHVRTSNWLRSGGVAEVHVDGVIPLAVYEPSLLLPHYKKDPSAKCTLEVIARQELKMTVLEDSALTNHVKLRVRTRSDFSSLRPLMTYPHQWKKLNIDVEEFDVDDFINVFKPCLPHLEELNVGSKVMSSSGIVLPPNSYPQLKTARLDFAALSVFFHSGILSSITSLTLDNVDAYGFPNHEVFKKALNNLPLVLSRLSYLRELNVEFIKCGHNDIEGLQRVHSTSLRSLQVNAGTDTTTIAFLNLLADCPIDRLDLDFGIGGGRVLEEAEGLFGKARHVVCRYSVADILFLLERKQDGSIAFPELDQIELLTSRLDIDNRLSKSQNCLLGGVRMRYDDPVVCKISHLRVPRELVSHRQFQDELERYVSSLVLF